MTETLPPDGPILWRADLRPYRSLTPRGFTAVMMALAVVSFISGIVFVRIGAWPVCGFFGLDVLLVWWGFRLNYKGARMREILELRPDRFTVARIDARGAVTRSEFQPYWLRVELIEQAHGLCRIRLASHGKRIGIGGFLPPEARRALADDLAHALIRARQMPGL